MSVSNVLFKIQTPGSKITLLEAHVGLLKEFHLLITTPGAKPVIRVHASRKDAMKDLLSTVASEIAVEDQELLAQIDGLGTTYTEEPDLGESKPLALFDHLPKPDAPDYLYRHEDLRCKS